MTPQQVPVLPQNLLGIPTQVPPQYVPFPHHDGGPVVVPGSVNQTENFGAPSPPLPIQGAWFSSPQLQNANPYPPHHQVGMYPYLGQPSGPQHPTILQLQDGPPDCPECKVGYLVEECNFLTWMLLVLGMFLLIPLIFIYCTAKSRCNNCGARFNMGRKRIG